MTGATNVTGEVWPVAELAELAHHYGARILVDCAQLAPHRPIDIAGLDLDWVAFSGHKLYAPFGSRGPDGPAGLAGRQRPLSRRRAERSPEVSARGVDWTDLPDRHEGGSPNVVGAFALAAACRALGRIGMGAVVRRRPAWATCSASGWPASRGW